jgi:hypothetical protein
MATILVQILLTDMVQPPAEVPVPSPLKQAHGLAVRNLELA